MVGEGKLYPSITTVLKKDLRAWREKVGEEEANRISKTATAKGTEIHGLIYEYLMNNSPALKESYPELFEILEPKLQLMKPMHMEIVLWSDILKVAGTADFIGLVGDIPYIVDFKTFTTDGGDYDHEILENYYLQATAYSVMAYERLGFKTKNLKIMKICPWKYSESVYDFDITFNSKLLSKLLERIKTFYKNHVVFPQVSS